MVDDSGDGQVVRKLESEFPAVRWIAHSENLGFGSSANEAILASSADIVILLNDDVQLLNNPCSILESCFEDSSLFAVTFRSENLEGRFREGAKRLVWKSGFPKILHNRQTLLG